MTKDLSKEDNVLERVSFVMDEFGYTPIEFANLTGVSRTTTANLKTGKAEPTVKFLLTITKVLPVSKDWLFLGKGNPFTVDDITPHLKGNKKKYDPINRDQNRRFGMIREDSGLTQALFASELGVTKYTVTNIETYKNGINTVILEKLVYTFKVNPIWFLTGSGNRYLANKMVSKDN